MNIRKTHGRYFLFNSNLTSNHLLLFHSQFKLAALRETKCICTNEFVKGKQINVDKNACQSRCNGDPEDTCGGQSGWQVYKIVEKCTKGRGIV